MNTSVIKGGIAEDFRGAIRFVNNFDMSEVKRFYIIENADTKLVRGWRAHKLEQRWFYVLSGSFILSLVKIDNWDLPSNNLPIETRELKAIDNCIFHVPIGFATAIRAQEEGSKLLVFGDYRIDDAVNDNYTFPLEHFVTYQNSNSMI